MLIISVKLGTFTDVFPAASTTTTLGVTALESPTRLLSAVLRWLDYAATFVVTTWVATQSAWPRSSFCSGASLPVDAGGKV